MADRTCTVQGCGKEFLARGYCGMHYRRWRLYGDPGCAEMLKPRHAPGATQKPCTLCRLTLPLAAFPAASWGVLGVGSRCRQCEKDYLSAYYQSHRGRILAQVKDYQERHTDQIASRRRDYYAANRAEVTARIRAYERARPWLRAEWQSRRRARVKLTAIIPITPEQVTAKLTYWAHKCWMCGGPATAWDHVKPLTHGGPHILANLRPACGPCNSRKSNRWPFSTARRS